MLLLAILLTASSRSEPRHARLAAAFSRCSGGGESGKLLSSEIVRSFGFTQRRGGAKSSALGLLTTGVHSP